MALSLLCLAGGVLASCDSSTGPQNGPLPPAATITIDSVSVQEGRTVLVPIRLVPNLNGPVVIDSIQSFQIAFHYDYRALQFIGASLGLETSSWSALSYNGVGLNNIDKTRTTIRLVGRRKSPVQQTPDGEIASLTFFALPQTSMVPEQTDIGFAFDECKDNTLTDAANDSLLHFMQALKIGDSIFQGSGTLLCPRLYSISPDLEFVTGAVHIEPDSLSQARGDLTHDDFVDIMDVIDFTNRFLRDDTAFSDDPVIRERQLQELDVNWDGMPLQVSDLEMLIRLALQGLDPNEPLWPITEYAILDLAVGPGGTTIVLQSETPVTMLYLDIEHGPREFLTIDYVSDGRSPYEKVTRGAHTVIFFEDFLRGAIANSFRPFEIQFRTSPSEPVCLRAVQASTRPGIAVPVRVPDGDRCH